MSTTEEDTEDESAVVLMKTSVIKEESGGKKLNTDNKGTDVSDGEEKNTPQQPITLRKEITLFSTVAFVIGKIIGSGIFITPSRVLRYSGSFGLTLILWSIGGVFAIGGGLCYVELGSMIRNSGGEYAYLKESYTIKREKRASVVFGNLLGFLFSWSYSFFIRPSATAVIVLAFGRYFTQAVAGGDTPPDASVRLCAIAATSEFNY